MATIANLSLDKNDRLAIEAAVRLLSQQFPVKQIILYGSKVTGQDTNESDIDLLVLTDYSLPWQDRNAIIDALFEVELTYDVVISPLVVPFNEWRAGYYTLLPIHYEIEQHGVVA